MEKNPPQDRSPEQLVSLAERVAVVTGAGQGIGRAVARRYAQAGARVLLADLDAGNAEAAARELAADLGADAVGLGVDVSSEESVEQLAAAARERHGRLDVWANFAAVYPMRREQFADTLEFPLEEWNRTLAVNLTGAFLCSRAAAREMVAAGNGGVIINTSTTMVDRYPSHRGMLAYATSKGAIEQLTMMLAAELGPRGIRALAIKPTVVATEGFTEHIGVVAEVTGVAEPFGELEQVMPLRRFGVPDDIARVALFAASDLAAFMTGSVLPVDGGELTI
jgi:NAD(P)-dependent dehydrogenase (short-subunit alcohol dehydrogenase family)